MGTTTVLSEDAIRALESAREPSCAKCIHFQYQVCGLSRSFIGMIGAAYPQDEELLKSPIRPLDLAKICKAYTPSNGVLTA